MKSTRDLRLTWPGTPASQAVYFTLSPAVASYVAPVTRLAASVQRKTTDGATSSGCIHGIPITACGNRAATTSCSVGLSFGCLPASFSASFQRPGLRVIGVSVRPGSTQLIVTPFFATSHAADFIRPITPHFDAE